MERKCQKCGVVKKGADMTLDEACPSCGVIYSKAAIAAAKTAEVRARVAERAASQAKPADEAGRPTNSGNIAWSLALVGSLGGAYWIANTWVMAESAPQQAAGAAMAVACAAIPYCFARAVEKLIR